MTDNDHSDVHAELADALLTIAEIKGEAARDILKRIETLQSRLRDALISEYHAFQRLADAAPQRAKRRESRRPQGNHPVEYIGETKP